jgi:hypothetical protein
MLVKVNLRTSGSGSSGEKKNQFIRPTSTARSLQSSLLLRNRFPQYEMYARARACVCVCVCVCHQVARDIAATVVLLVTLNVHFARYQIHWLTNKYD